jgi:hypothetical protein
MEALLDWRSETVVVQAKVTPVLQVVDSLKTSDLSDFLPAV